MIKKMHAKHLFLFALLAAAVGPMAGCGGMAHQKDFDDYKMTMARKLATIKSDAAEARELARLAREDTADAKKAMVAATTAAKKATKAATLAGIKVDVVARENSRINGVITNGVLPRLATTEQSANVSKTRAEKLDKTDLPALKKAIKDLQDKDIRLTSDLDGEVATRKDLAKKAAVLDTSLAKEREAREKQEKRQAEINTKVDITSTGLDKRVENNAAGIAARGAELKELTRSTKKRLDEQDKTITEQNRTLDEQSATVKHLLKKFEDMLEANRKLFSGLLSATITARKAANVKAATPPPALSATGPEGHDD